MSAVIMGKLLHMSSFQKTIVYKYRQRDSLPKLKVLTEKPVQGPIDLPALRRVPMATAVLETEATSQRVLVALEEDYDRHIGDLSCLTVEFQDLQSALTEMNLPLCILFRSNSPDFDECVYLRPIV